jgi:hypothetical protein
LCVGRSFPPPMSKQPSHIEKKWGFYDVANVLVAFCWWTTTMSISYGSFFLVIMYCVVLYILI